MTNTLEYTKLAIGTFKYRKKRTFLTIIGIIIGMAAVVSLISIGEGMKSAIDQQFETMGPNKIMVFPSGPMFGMGLQSQVALTQEDVEIVEDTTGVKIAGGMIVKIGRVKFKDESKYTYLAGVPAGWSITSMAGIDIISGRNLKESDTYKVVIGQLISTDKIFETGVKLNNRINIEDTDFKVVGILDTVGNSQDDMNIYMPIEMAREVFDEPEKVMTILAETKEGYEPDYVADKITEKLRKERGVKKGEEDFEVQTMEDLQRTYNTVFSIIELIVLGIAGISLVVGGIGIMNTMFSSVLERTRDIGIMKAIGAKNSDVLFIFLIESGLLGMIGGGIGCLIGVVMAKITEFAGEEMAFGLLKADITPKLILFTLGFSLLVGCLSGFLPARRAAKLNPVEALRYE